MSRDSKRKLAIAAGISECLVHAEAKYCAFEIHGEPKYYVCPRTEYCCNFGCCVSPGFQIYHLWYYWLLVIIMFLVCSGGGWWYRYWLQGRYRAAASAIPSRGASNSRGQSTLPGRTCPAQQASITYNSARNTVLLHRMWKGGPHRGPGSSPAYTGPPVAAAASSAAHFQNTSVVLNDVNCPYYQLYGPPPSYETVIAQTRGKLSSPLSPEHSRNVADPSSATSTSGLQSQDILPTRCYNHSPYNNNNNNNINNNHPSHIGSTIGGAEGAISRYEQSATVIDTIHRLETFEGTTGFPRTYAPPYTSNGELATPVHTTGRQDTCLLPLHRHGGPLPQLDYQETRDATLERLPSCHIDGCDTDTRTRRTNCALPSATTRDHQRLLSRQIVTGEAHSSVPDLNIEIAEFYGRRGRAERKTSGRDDQRYTRGPGGSLKFSRPQRDEIHSSSSRRAGPKFLNFGASSWPVADGNSSTIESSIELDFHDGGTLVPRSTRKGILACDNGRGATSSSSTHHGNDRQTNPSDNVILEPLTSVNINEDATMKAGSSVSSTACWRTRRRDDDDNVDNEDDDDDAKRAGPRNDDRQDHHDEDQSLVAASSNNHESKHNKLDRSKSLD